MATAIWRTLGQMAEQADEDMQIRSAAGDRAALFGRWGRRVLAVSAVVVLVLAWRVLPAGEPRAAAVRDWGSAQQLFGDAELHSVVSDAVAAAGRGRFDSPGAQDRLRSEVAAGLVAAGARGGPGMTAAQRSRLLRAVRSLSDMRLQRRAQQAAEAGTYEFQCSDEGEGVGTGQLGTGAGADEPSASDVVVRADTATGVAAKQMEFTIGPPVGCCGEHVISGRMDVLESTSNGLSGNITAGFMNLRSTLRGSWTSGVDGLEGAIHIHLSDLGMEKDWTWQPTPADEATRFRD